jgi:hypothetical protein
MKNITRTNWTRYVDGRQDVTYTHEPNVDTLVSVHFDGVLGDFEVVVTDLGGHENDHRIKARGAFCNEHARVQHILSVAETMRLHTPADNAPFA